MRHVVELVHPDGRIIAAIPLPEHIDPTLPIKVRLADCDNPERVYGILQGTRLWHRPPAPKRPSLEELLDL